MASSRTRVTKTVTVRHDSPVPKKRQKAKKSGFAVVAIILAIGLGFMILNSNRHTTPHVRTAASNR